MSDQKVALITGASRGLGQALALKLAEHGYHIIALARNVKHLEALDDAIKAKGGSATLIPADLKDDAALLSLGPSLAERFGRLDMFVANAGLLGGLFPMAQTKPDLWDDIYAVNVRANHRLIGTLDPLLRASKGQVVFVSSGAVAAAKPFWSAYASSKAALEVMARCYQKEVEQAGVRVSVFDPGRFRSSMRAEAYPGEDPNSLDTPEQVADRLWAVLDQPLQQRQSA